MTEYRLGDPFKDAILPSHSAYWITTISMGGKFVVLGPYFSEAQAQAYGARHFGGDCEVELLNTRDVAKATRILKKKRFDSVHDLDVALERASHQVPEGRR